MMRDTPKKSTAQAAADDAETITTIMMDDPKSKKAAAPDAGSPGRKTRLPPDPARESASLSGMVSKKGLPPSLML